jgi:hypothetical protein
MRGERSAVPTFPSEEEPLIASNLTCSILNADGWHMREPTECRLPGQLGVCGKSTFPSVNTLVISGKNGRGWCIAPSDKAYRSRTEKKTGQHQMIGGKHRGFVSFAYLYADEETKRDHGVWHYSVEGATLGFGLGGLTEENIYPQIRAAYKLPYSFRFDYVYLLLGKDEIHQIFEKDEIIRGYLPFDFADGRVQDLVDLLGKRVEGLATAFQPAVVGYGCDPCCPRPVKGLPKSENRSAIEGSTGLAEVSGPDFLDYWCSVWESHVSTMVEQKNFDRELVISLPFSRYPQHGVMGDNGIFPMSALCMMQRDLYNNLTRLWLRGKMERIPRRYVTCAGIPERLTADMSYSSGVPPWVAHSHSCGTKCCLYDTGSKTNFGNFQKLPDFWKFNVGGKGLPLWRKRPGFDP